MIKYICKGTIISSGRAKVVPFGIMLKRATELHNGDMSAVVESCFVVDDANPAHQYADLLKPIGGDMAWHIGEDGEPYKAAKAQAAITPLVQSFIDGGNQYIANTQAAVDAETADAATLAKRAKVETFLAQYPSE